MTHRSDISQRESELSIQRHRMVADQLRARGITDERVLKAMGEVPRERFLPVQMRNEAYQDRALPIDAGQTMSQPYTVGFMCQALRLQGHEKVLEIGAGSGYGAAVLSRLAKEVYSVERLPELTELTSERLTRLGFPNVQIVVGDGTLGLPDKAPFDAIVVTAGGGQLPKTYFSQLADGGRIVIPLGDSPRIQTLFRFTRNGDEMTSEDLGSFAFVPLIGAHGWAAEDAEE